MLNRAGLTALIKRRRLPEPVLRAKRVADVVHAAHAPSNGALLGLMARLRRGRGSSRCERVARPWDGVVSRSAQRVEPALVPNRAQVAEQTVLIPYGVRPDPPLVQGVGLRRNRLPDLLFGARLRGTPFLERSLLLPFLTRVSNLLARLCNSVGLLPFMAKVRRNRNNKRRF